MRRRFWIDGKPSRVGEEGCHAYHHRMRKRHRVQPDASSANPDLFITVKELAPELHGNVVIVRSYVNKKKIREDALEAIKAAAANA